jgi:hypothetical protein
MVDGLSKIAIKKLNLKIKKKQFPSVKIWDYEFLDGKRPLGIHN